MKLPVVLQDEAQSEFDNAFDWYDSQRAGPGSEFVAEVRKVFDRIAANPMMHQAVFADVRQGVVRRFPYSVFCRPTRIELRFSRCFTAGAIRRSGKDGPNQTF